MDLVKVDIAGAQPMQAVLDLAPQPRRRRIGKHAALVPLKARLGSNVERVAPAMGPDHFADNLLGTSAAVDRRRIDKVDAAFDGTETGGNRRILCNRAPFRPADGPGSQADSRDFDPR